MNKEEEKLVKLYTGLTGASESCARGVFMLVCPENEETAENNNKSSRQDNPNPELGVADRGR